MTTKTKTCGAKTRSGGRCKRPGTGAGSRCKFHGGATPVGPAAAAWKHGRHSKYLPSGIVERYQEGLKDPDLISLRSEVALTDMRIGQLLEALGESGNTRLWREARVKLDALKGLGSKGKTSDARVALQALDDLITSGLTASATWEELRELIDLRRKLAADETKREKDLLQMIPVSQVYALFRVFLEGIQQRVQDRQVLADITTLGLRLVGRGATPPVSGGPS